MGERASRFAQVISTRILSAILVLGFGHLANAEVIRDIGFQFIGGAMVSEGAILANMKSKVGEELDHAGRDEELKRR